MYVTTNSAMVWKRMADENQQSARLLTRINIGLLVITGLIGAYAYTVNARYAELCVTIQSDAPAVGAAQVKKTGGKLIAEYCG